MAIQTHGHLFFVPILPLGRRTEYVECATCHATFVPEVLAVPQVAGSENPQAEFEKAVVLVALAIARADREMTAEERRIIDTIYMQMTQRRLSEELYEAQLRQAKKWGFDVKRIVREIRPRLNDYGRELVLRSAAIVARTDGRVQEAERKLLSGIARELEMTPTHSRAVLRESGIAGNRP